MTALERMEGTLTKAGWSAFWKLGREKSSRGDYFALFQASNRSQRTPWQARMTFKEQSNESISPKKAVKLFAHHYSLQMFTTDFSPYARLELADFLSDNEATLGARIEKATAWELEGAQWITGVDLLKHYPLEKEELKYVLDTLFYQRINQTAALRFCGEIFGAGKLQGTYPEKLTLGERLRLFFYLQDSAPTGTLGSYRLKAPKDFVPHSPLEKSRYSTHRTNIKGLFHHYAFHKEKFEALGTEGIRKLFHAGPIPALSDSSYALTVQGLQALPRAFARIEFTESTVSTPSGECSFEQVLKRLTDLLDSGEALSVCASMRASGRKVEAYGAGLFNIALSGYLFRYAYGRFSREKFLTLVRLRALKLVEDLDFWIRLVESFAEDELSEEELRLALHLL